MAGVDQQELEAPLLEDVPAQASRYWRGRLHDDLVEALGGQRLGQCVSSWQVRRAERPDLLAPTAAVIGDPHTRPRPRPCRYRDRHSVHTGGRLLGSGHLRVGASGARQDQAESTSAERRARSDRFRGAGKVPASVLSTGSRAPRGAELGRAHVILIPVVVARGHGFLSAIRVKGLPAQDRRYGPFSARPDPEHLKSSHKSVARSIPAPSIEASSTWISEGYYENCVVTVTQPDLGPP